ncbi:hypothetical protein SAMN05192545_2904 [Maribacter dokdonensis]|uniref:LPXTG-motif cell wall anchor domain-containing protein n=1 Tax=Maribacter dokdonensis TaxID=320912 RepID=A0ABY0UTJ0_9FLAO|nr:hypothetical protein [Maribacter dokdonensis]SDT15943.1 hypothetical protein SAMN05192545_2904 [Maribacter dokdonensis]
MTESIPYIALGISVVALIAVIGVFVYIKKKMTTSTGSIKAEKIVLPGYEVKVVNGELSFTPTK